MKIKKMKIFDKFFNDKKKFIIEEIKLEKKLSIIIFLIFLIFFIISIIFLFFIYLEIKTKWSSSIFGFLIFLSITFFFIFSFCILFYYFIKKEEKTYFSNYKNLNLKRIPIFVEKSYKRKIRNKIILNWVCFSSYSWIMLILVFSSLSQSEYTLRDFLGTDIIFKAVNNDNNIMMIIIICSIYIFFIFLIHSSLYIVFYNEEKKIQELFDLNNKSNKLEIKKFKKKWNIICSIFFSIPTLITYISIWFLKKKKII